jgi:hypothetical protein
MKKLTLMMFTLFSLTLSLQAIGQTKQDPDDSKSPVTSDTPDAKVQSKTKKPTLRRWGFDVILGKCTDGTNTCSGGGGAISVMFNRHWGFEFGIEGYDYSAHDLGPNDPGSPQEHTSRVYFSALWFPLGVKRNGFNLYFKCGLTTTENNRGSQNEMEEELESALHVGSGLDFRFVDGLIKIGVEVLAIDGTESPDGEYSPFHSGSLNLRLNMGFRFESGWSLYSLFLPIILAF